MKTRYNFSLSAVLKTRKMCTITPSPPPPIFSTCVCAVRQQQHLQVVWLGEDEEEEEEHVVVDPGAMKKVVDLDRIKTGLQSTGITLYVHGIFKRGPFFP
jgi:hypothetical protein